MNSPAEKLLYENALWRLTTRGILRNGTEATVEGGTLSSPRAPLCGHNDHRIVMALATLATLVGGCIEGAEAVKKSLPEYFEILTQLGAEVTYEAK